MRSYEFNKSRRVFLKIIGYTLIDLAAFIPFVVIILTAIRIKTFKYFFRFVKLNKEKKRSNILKQDVKIPEILKINLEDHEYDYFFDR